MNKDKRLVARFIAAFALARLVKFLLLGPLSGALPAEVQWAIAEVAMFAVMGLLQGLSLMAYDFKRTLALGVLSACAGGLVYGLAAAGLTGWLGAVPAWAGYGFVTGAVLGGLQLIVLRPLLSRRALWPLLLGLAWAAGFALEHGLVWMLLESATLSQYAAVIGAADVLASMVIGGITGVVFILLHGDSDERAR